MGYTKLGIGKPKSAASHHRQIGSPNDIICAARVYAKPLQETADSSLQFAELGPHRVQMHLRNSRASTAYRALRAAPGARCDTPREWLDRRGYQFLNGVEVGAAGITEPEGPAAKLSGTH